MCCIASRDNPRADNLHAPTAAGHTGGNRVLCTRRERFRVGLNKPRLLAYPARFCVSLPIASVVHSHQLTCALVSAAAPTKARGYLCAAVSLSPSSHSATGRLMSAYATYAINIWPRAAVVKRLRGGGVRMYTTLLRRAGKKPAVLCDVILPRCKCAGRAGLVPVFCGHATRAGSTLDVALCSSPEARASKYADQSVISSPTLGSGRGYILQFPTSKVR